MRNVRAADGRVFLGRRERRAARLTEIPPDARPPVIRAYLHRTGRTGRSWGAAREARYYFGVSTEPTGAELRGIAGRYPVFRVDYRSADAHPATGRARRKRMTRNVELVEAWVSLLFDVESDADDRRVLRVHGHATVRTDRRLCRWYLRRDVRNYFMNRRGPTNTLAHARLLPAVRDYLSGSGEERRCVLEVLPQTCELLPALGALPSPEATPRR